MSEEKTINIHVPVLARVEGEGALDLVIEDDLITELKLRIFEPPRFFEKFLETREPDQVIDMVARICGICPVAYQMTAVQAIESLFGTIVTPWISAMRRAFYCGEWLQSHALHIHMLALPDFLGFSNVMEMATQYPAEVRRGLKLQALGNDLIALFGARSVHPVGVCTGGFHHAPSKNQVNEICDRLQQAQGEARELLHWILALDLPDEKQDFISVSLQHSADYPMDTGDIVSDHGLKIDAYEFSQHFTEQQIEHSTALYCFLDNQPYLVGPLARVNLNYEKIPGELQSLIEKHQISFPSKNMFHSIIARALEINMVIDEALHLLADYQTPVKSRVDWVAQSGTACAATEAPRGLLWHRYEIDNTGYVSEAQIVPPTSQNQARIEQNIQQSLHSLGLQHSAEQLQLHAEKVIRNYDPCISCATHFLNLNITRQ